MAALNMNHVSLSALALDESVHFYEDLFDVQRIATPAFAIPVQWLRLASMQLHLFEAPGTLAPHAHHFAVTVTLEDFEAIFAKAQRANQLDSGTFGHHLYELPGGEGQMYLRDPAGNLVEVNCAGVAEAGPAVRAETRKLSEERPQSAENLRARLYLDGAS